MRYFEATRGLRPRDPSFLALQHDSISVEAKSPRQQKKRTPPKFSPPVVMASLLHRGHDRPNVQIVADQPP